MLTMMMTTMIVVCEGWVERWLRVLPCRRYCIESNVCAFGVSLCV